MNKRLFVLTSCALASIMAVLAACDDDDDNNIVARPDAAADAPASGFDANSGGDANDSQFGSLSGTVTYAGTRAGTANIALFKEFAPPAPPSGLAGATEVVLSNGSARYTISNVVPGTYWLNAYLGSRAGGLQPTDPLSQPVQVTITAGQTAAQDVVLRDRPPRDAGPEAGDAGDAG